MLSGGLIVRELVTKLGFKVDENKLKSADRGFKNIAMNMAKMGGIAAAAAVAVKTALAPAVDLEDKLRDALILTGKTGKEFDNLNKNMTDSAQQLSDELGASAEDVAVGFYQVLSTGAEAMSPQFMAVAKTSIKFAKTVGLDVASSVEKLSDTINAFSLAGTEAERVASVLFVTSRLGATTVPQLTDAMREAAPVAAGLGVSLETTSAILAAMAGKGEKGARAGTALKMILNRLTKPPKEVTTALKKMNVKVFDSTGKFRDLIDIFKDMKAATAKMTQQQRAFALGSIAGADAVSKLTGILANDLDKVKSWNSELDRSATAINVAFGQRMDTAARNMDRVMFSIKNLAAELGQPFLESVKGSLLEVADFIQVTREWVEANSELVQTFRDIYGFIRKFSILGPMIDAPLALLKAAKQRLQGGAPGTEPGLSAAGAAAKAGNVTMTNHNNITVTPPEGSDAEGQGQAVADSIENKNNQALINAKQALQGG